MIGFIIIQLELVICQKLRQQSLLLRSLLVQNRGRWCHQHDKTLYNQYQTFCQPHVISLARYAKKSGLLGFKSEGLRSI